MYQWLKQRPYLNLSVRVVFFAAFLWESFTTKRPTFVVAVVDAAFALFLGWSIKGFVDSRRTLREPRDSER